MGTHSTLATGNRQLTGPDVRSSRGGGAAGIFNSVVAGFAVATAWEIGALDELNDAGRLSVPAFCTSHDLHLASVRSLFAALASAGVVVRAGDTVSIGPEFADVYQNKAFFHWLTIGCGELFAAMPRIVRNQNRTGEYYQRDAAAIAFACREINARSFDPVFWQAMQAVDFPFSTVADLGCGSGGRLAQIADRFPQVRGIGVDISADALHAAETFVDQAGFGDRLRFIEADVLALTADERFEDVELLTSFMMGHDFWPREQCVTVLRRLRQAFPNVRRFLLGDTARTQGIPDEDKPVFTLAFETAHDLMGVDLPTLADWAGVFEEGGWRCVNVREVRTPADSVIYELEPLR
ncbi:MAG: class I SAM-dependent methyltransferase [Kibdelosporangium sp.]